MYSTSKKSYCFLQLAFYRLPIRAPAAVIFYQKMMGGVDRLDKVVALANIRIRRCNKRYHRAIFFWFISTIGFNNVKVIFEHIIGKEEVMKLRKKHRRMGYFHWFQDTLAEVVIEKFLARAAAEAARHEQQNTSHVALEEAEKSGDCTSLHFVPAKYQPQRTVFTPSDQPVLHRYCHINDIKLYDAAGKEAGTLPRNRCEVCMTASKEAGLYNKEDKTYYMPNGKQCPRPIHGCNVCMVNLCKPCMDKYDHKRNRSPASVAVSLFAPSLELAAVSDSL